MQELITHQQFNETSEAKVAAQPDAERLTEKVKSDALYLFTILAAMTIGVSEYAHYNAEFLHQLESILGNQQAHFIIEYVANSLQSLEVGALIASAIHLLKSMANNKSMGIDLTLGGLATSVVSANLANAPEALNDTLPMFLSKALPLYVVVPTLAFCIFRAAQNIDKK